MKKAVLLILSLMLVTACSAVEEKPVSSAAPKTENNQSSSNTDQKPGTASQPAQSKTPQKTQPQKDSKQASTSKPASSSPKTKHVSVIIKDESAKDPSLIAFLNKLKSAVKNKDKNALLSVLDDQIKVSFGGDSGKQDFIRYWKLNNQPEKSAVWKELEEMLALGGNFSKYNKSAYSIPYLFENFPQAYDPFSYSAVIGQRVNLRAKPDRNARVITQLSNEVVKVQPPLTAPTMKLDGYRYRWIPVTTLSDQKGYILEKYVRSPIDYRMNIKKNQSGQWKITFFVSGD
jgi:Tfp pilus assembly protein PilP